VGVTGVAIERREPYESGRPFGDAGPYERLDGTVYFAVDPSHPANAGIVDLAEAPRDDQGRVRFEADLCLLQPVTAPRGGGRGAGQQTGAPGSSGARGPGTAGGSAVGRRP
jgi:hypothetical protein